MTSWLPAVRTTIRRSTYVGYEGHVRNHIVPALGELRLDELTPGHLNRLYSLLLGVVHSERAGLSPTTVRRIHATLHRALRDAVRWGLVGDNPAGRSDPPKQTRDWNRLHTWSAEQLRQFLEFVGPDDLFLLWLTIAMTGLRRGEALGLRWGDVDLERGELAIRQTVLWVGGRVEISEPKTGRGRRVVALDESTAVCLGAARPPGCDDDRLVFCGEDGTPLHPNHVSKRFRRLVDASGLPRIRLHDLRHTHATIALRAGVHPKIVSERLGHATVAFTLDVYSHSLPHLQAEAASRIAALVSWDGRDA